MKSSFEERLAARCGAENVKAAKQLLKNDRLLGAWRDRENRLCGRFSDEEGASFECAVETGDEARSFCPCRSETPLCAHGAALIMYSGAIAARRRLVDEPPPSYYAGLKQEDFSRLARRCRPPTAYLELEACIASPHVPSKWENVTFAVALYGEGGRKYLGNLNNLRKLYFDKNLGVTLRYEDFSLQEQQIIRFLAVAGEISGGHVMLDAEATAEFFHVLVGFPRFFRDGKVLTIHGEPAAPVLIASGKKLHPGFMVGGAAIPSGSVKVVAGRAGCWLGRDGEYFFIPATCEITFLRNFFRSGPQTVPAGTTREEYLADFPFPVVFARSPEPKQLTPQILLDGGFSEGMLLLSVRYLYDESLLPMHTGTFVRNGRSFCRRDRELENRFETALELFGFTLDGNEAKLDCSGRADRAGFFLDKVLPDYLARYPQIALGATLAALCRGGKGVESVEFETRLQSEVGEGYILQYRISGNGRRLSWDHLAERAASRSDYCLDGAGAPLRIPSELGRFFRAADSVVRNLNPTAETFEVPRFSLRYFLSLVRPIPGALPEELRDGNPEKILIAPPDFRFEGTLREYQKEGVAFLQWMTDRNFNPLLADEMGLGKTVQILALLASRLKRDGAPALVVCPASLVVNWEREARRFVPDLVVAAPQGGERKHLFGDQLDCNLLILSYTAARLSREELARIDFDFVILDEAQHIKNPGSGNAKNCKDLKSRHRAVLTGTPLENSPEDLWSVMDFLQPGMLGTLAEFRRRYADVAADGELREDLAMRVAPFILRRTKAEVGKDLPGKSELVFYCDLAPDQRRLYDRVLEEGRRSLAAFRRGDARGNATIFNTLLRLRQICCDPALLPGGAGKGVSSAKTELLTELLHETIDSSHKVLLFSQFTSLLQSLIPALEKENIRFEYLDGSTLRRQERVDRFNERADIPLFLLSLKAGGTGLNLTSADRVIIYDPWWNPAVELQATDRTHRIGQTRAVTTMKLVVRDSIEEKILELQGRKRKLFDQLVETGGNSALSLDELRFLLEEPRS
ncbi:MAG: DEAD/DEAH box helicase [Victivallaceae bacterium]|nr:DEAD/DEAH box helicase [Victivallaceae bacterium]